MAKMTVYHGGFMLVEHPEIRIGRNTKDFGTGFYCTIIKEQAQRWAKRYDTKVVSIYEVRLNSNLRIKDFKDLTDEWLDFIIDCRSIWKGLLPENNSGYWQNLNIRHIRLIFVQMRH